MKRLWFVVLIVFLAVVTVVVGSLFGANIAAQILTLIATLAGTIGAAEKLFPPPPVSDDAASTAPVSGHPKVVGVVLFTIGVAAGYGAPRIAAWVYPPTPTIEVSAAPEVSMIDHATVTWRNIPAQDEVWLLVYDREVYYPQEFRVRSVPKGAARFDIKVGRKDQAGGAFEIIPVLATPEAQKQLQEHIVDGMFNVPVGALPFRERSVRRKDS